MNVNYQRPRWLELEELTNRYGKFVAEPFERGYGSTIGIALRRVLLSMIQGAAITAVRIEGVLHEFAVMPGVFEDVLNVILNMKNVPFKLLGDESKVVRIHKTSGTEVTSADIETVSGVEVLDTKLHIAFLEEGTTFSAELVIDKGMGYRLSELNFNETLSIDFIPVDSNFNPVEKVKYTILPARVGKRTDYEKLILEVWTNGSICPRECVSLAGQVLRDHLAIFLNFQDQNPIVAVTEKDPSAGLEAKTDVLMRGVETMGLSVRALKCLKKLGVDFIYELVEKTEHELLNSKNFGKKSLEEIIAKLMEYELVLGQRLTDIHRKTLEKKVGTEASQEETDEDEKELEE
jgi:DNA-directed RNA polymerase subunit alpha